MKTKIILGPPGCGKTTRLLSLMDEHLKQMSPREMAYVSFTKRAVTEAMERACDKFNLLRKDFPYFKTLHALAYNELGISRNSVMGRANWQELGNLLSVEFTGYYNMEEGVPSGSKDGDQLLYIDSMARVTMSSIKEVLYQTGVKKTLQECALFSETLQRYKKERHLLDFTDMLERYIEQKITLPIKVGFIDEAQDLSLLQWAVVRRAFRNCEQVYISGDDDQCIFEWSGAAIDHFLHIKAETEVLHQSWRLPSAVWKLANTISHRLTERLPKPWAPRIALGKVEYISDIYDLSLSNGSWLLLARNNYMLNKLETLARDQAVPYLIKHQSSVHPDNIRTKADQEYLMAVLRNGYQQATMPRVTISTIHGAKGGEADNVCLMTDMAGQCYESMQHNMDAETRVFYVGATRAKENLFIVQPQGRYFYEV